MKIPVTIKLVIYPDIPQSKFKINLETKYYETEVSTMKMLPK